MLASGFAGLAYQVVWTQQSALWLGHESAAVLAVIAAFFGGLALGALLLGSRIERSPRPARWYAGCEVAIGVWSLGLALFFEPATATLLALIGPDAAPLWHWTVAFCGTLLLLLPATAAMGATLPAMEPVLAGLQQRRAIGILYAANTLGAALGALAGALWLIPLLGLTLTASVCAILNFGCAALALRLPARVEQAVSTVPPQTAPASLLPLLAATGLLGIGYEVLLVRALSQIAENTVYTFAILLAVYLIGTTLGAALYANWLIRSADLTRLRDRLLQALAGLCLLGTLLLAWAEHAKSWLARALGLGMGAALAAEAILAALAFLLPTLVMGALFSHLSTTARAAGISFGRALSVNTFGAALAPLIFGVLLMPLLGLKAALLLVGGSYLLLATRSAWTTPAQWAMGAATVALIAWAPSLLMITVPSGGRIVSHTEGVTASVSVLEDVNGIATLHINNRQQEGSSATLLADARQALLPVLLHPTPHSALFLGVGTGVTASVATADRALRVDAVELVPEVIAAASHFTRSLPEALDRSRLHLLTADARRFVRATDARYDVIVSDNFHPARSGSGSLYTVEHFGFVRSRLAQGGLFCQWLPLHQLDLDTLRSIVRSFLTVYPQGSAMLATNSLETPVLGLVARRDGERFDIAQVRARLRGDSMSLDLAEFGVADDLALLGGFVAGPRELTRFAADAPLNTDDHPVVSYRAPRVTYAPDSSARDRLIALLHQLDVSPDEVLAPSASGSDREWRTRLAAYWVARERFIEAGRNIEPTSNVRRMVAQVREPLLSVLRVSPDFRPAYDPLLRMAAELSSVDVGAARTLLAELQHAQPARPEAGDALRQLAAISP